MNFISWKPSDLFIETLKSQTNKLANVQLDRLSYKERISSLVESLSPLIQTFEKNPPINKYFAHWLGSKNLKRAGRFDPELVAAHLLTNVQEKVWKGKLFKLQDKIVKFTNNFLSGALAEKKIPRHFKSLSIENLDKKLYKSYHGIFSTSVLISQLKKNSESENINRIIKELKVWCLHYLVVSSKPPLIDFEGDEYLYPFGEYNENNEAHYHREDGGAIVKIFLSELKKRYHWLQTTQINLIKNNEFRKHIINCCKLFKLDNKATKYMKVEKLDLQFFIEKNGQNLQDHSILFLDFSRYIQDNLDKTNANSNNNSPNPLTALENFVSELSKHHNLLNLNLIYGATVTIANQDLYFFKSTTSELLNGFKNTFKTIQGTHGAYPEIMLVKRYLIDLGYSIKSFLNSYPIEQRKWFEIYLRVSPIFTAQFNENDVIREREDLIIHLKNLMLPNLIPQLTAFYLPFLHDLIKNMPNSLVIDAPKICETIVYRIRKIKKLLDNINEISDSKCLMRFHLIIEHIQYLLIFFKIESMETLPQLIDSIAPLVDSKIEKRTFTFTSGSACYGNIAEGLIQMFSDLDAKPNVFFGDTSYYELRDSNGSFGKCLESDFICTTASLTDFTHINDLNNQDVIFTDSYPNRVVFESVKKIEIEKVIHYILEKRKTNPEIAERPLVVVIDCATTFFMHDEMQETINQFSNAIMHGKLIIINTNSFTKYVGIGVDKFPGGIVQVFSSNELKNAESLCDYLRVSSAQDSFSPEASRTFYLLLKYCNSHILSYVDIIRTNTDRVYDLLTKAGLVIQDDQPSENPIQVGFRSNGIPMIGLHTNYIYKTLFGSEVNADIKHVIVIIIQYYLFEKLIEKNVPVTMKPSYGFLSSNLIECWSALRLTIGVIPKFFDLYPLVIQEANQEISLLFSSKPKQVELAGKIRFLAQQKKLMQKICSAHVTIFSGKQSGFENILDAFLGGIFNKGRQSH